MTNDQLFSSFNDLNVLIIGDVMVDRYVWGQVDRISPEAPVPVVHLQQEENRLGGAANLAFNIKTMGATPHLCSVIGDDGAGQIFRDLLPPENISAAGIIPSKERVTTIKTRVIAGAQHLLRIDEEQNHPLSEQDQEQLMAYLSRTIAKQQIDVILFQDYNKGVLNPSTIEQIIALAQKQQIPTVADPKFDHFFSFRGIDLFKPNLSEVRAALPFSISPNLQDLQKASDYIRQELNNRYTMITLSEKGIFLDRGDRSVILPTQARQIADVCGAGDTVISIAALGLAAQLPIEEVAALANLAGGQVCEKVGVVAVDKEQLREEYLSLISKIDR